MQALSHNVHQARALKALVAAPVAKRAGVSVTIVVRHQVEAVTLDASHVRTQHAVTSRLPTVASAVSPHVVTNPSHLAVTSRLLRVVTSLSQIVEKNHLRRVATNRLPRAVKNPTLHAVKNRLVIVAMPHAVINLMPHVAKILTRMHAPSHVRLNPAATVAPQSAPLTQVSQLVQRVTLRHVQQHPVAKRLLHAVMAQHVRVPRVQARHVLLQARVVALPLTAVAVKL